MIDRVTVKGSVEPLDLYTCDVDSSNLDLDPPANKLKGKDAKLKRVKARITRDKFRQKAFSGEIEVAAKFELDKDIIEMRAGYNDVILSKLKIIIQKFFEVFNKGF